MHRILYQSFGPSSNTPYLDVLRSVVDAAGASSGAAVELDGLPNARLGQKQHPAFHLAAGADVLDAVLAAEDAGCAAAVIGNIQDPALYECRQLCTIPVVGLLESTTAVALMLGRSAAFVTTAEATIPLIEDRLRLYGLHGRLTSIRPLSRGLASVSSAFADTNARKAILTEFRSVAAGAVEAGAEVVVPASGMLATLIAAEWGIAAGWGIEGEVPVINPVWSAVSAAAALAGAYAHGLRTSRRLMFRQPSAEEIEAYRSGRQALPR